MAGVEPTVEDFAREYLDILNGPVNGWGQNFSHNKYWVGIQRYGEKIFNDAFDAIIKERRHDLRRHRSP